MTTILGAIAIGVIMVGMPVAIIGAALCLTLERLLP